MSEKIGSFNDFVEQNNLENYSLAAKEYAVALDGLRRSLAEEKGITLDQLHNISLNKSNN
ncbi:MAG: hypothetical protein WCG30_00870 [Candidatus Saccharibacteria bacterium]